MTDFPVTLVHDDLGTVVAYSPGTRTQFLSQGYREVAPEQAPPTGLEALTIDQLKDEIRKRNEAREAAGQEPLPVSGTKADLVKVLEADDAGSAGE
jgi:hypothetical protein